MTSNYQPHLILPMEKKKMKSLITLIFIYLFINQATLGQAFEEPADNIVVIELIPKRTIYLNKGTGTLTGGITREVIQIQLPNNLVEWGYVISTYRNKSDMENAAGTTSLVNIIAGAYDKTGIISSAISTAFPISTESFCDIKLMDERNMRTFENKEDLLGNSLQWYRDGSSENFVGGKFAIKTITSGTWYVGIRNPSNSLPVGVTFEAYAFVRKRPLEELKQEYEVRQISEGINDLINSMSSKEQTPVEWNTETKESIHNYIVNYAIGKESQSSLNVSNCATQNIVNSVRLEQFNAMTEFERKQLITEKINDCLISLNELKLKKEIDQKKYFLTTIDSLNITDNHLQIAEHYKKILLLGFTINNEIYNNIGWYYLLGKNFEQARYYLKKGESIKPTDLYIQMNIAHLLLMQNKYNEAEDIYLRHKNEKLNGQKFKEIVKKDFQQFDLLGILPGDAQKIKKKLGI